MEHVEDSKCCEHNHAHSHSHSANRQKRKIVSIVVAIFLTVVCAFFGHYLHLSVGQRFWLYLVPYLIAGQDTLREAIKDCINGNALDEHFLMTIATFGSLMIGFLPGAESQEIEAISVMIFFQIGGVFESYAEKRSNDAIEHLLNLRPEKVNVIRKGERIAFAPDQVLVGEIIWVSPGEKIALDGVILEGRSSLNTSALTGESLPYDVAEGDEVLSGYVNLSGDLKIQTTKTMGESTVTKIIQLIKESENKKSQRETFITRFARIYTPIVVCSAVLLAMVPPFFSTGGYMEAFSSWLYRALMFLVVSCPCALVISVPLTFFGGIGAASRKGILVKGGRYLDMLSKVKTVVFDKTGTLTTGEFAVTKVHSVFGDEENLLRYVANAEQHTSHPIGHALRNAYKGMDLDGVSETEEMAGEGIRARIEDHIVCVGNARMMKSCGVANVPEADPTATTIHVAIDGVYAGYVIISDKIKGDSSETIKRLREERISSVMLTGDKDDVARNVSRRLQMNEYYAELLPVDKVFHIEQIMKRTPHGYSVAFVGDGINDAPVLARADIGIAMGGVGSDAAIEAADVVLMDDQPSKVVEAICLARQTISIANQNIVFAIGVKILVLILSAFGLSNMFMAVFADVGVTVIAVLNALRLLNK